MFHQIGENEEFTCKVKSEGGEGYYEPPEMQWIVGDGYPSYNENPYEKVIEWLIIASISYILEAILILSSELLRIHIWIYLQKGTNEWHNMFLYKPQIHDDGKRLMCKVENPEQILVSDYIDLHVVMFSTDLSSSKTKRRIFF